MASNVIVIKAHGSEKPNDLIPKGDRDMKEVRMSTSVPSTHKKSFINCLPSSAPVHTSNVKLKKSRRRLRTKKPKEHSEGVSLPESQLNSSSSRQPENRLDGEASHFLRQRLNCQDISAPSTSKNFTHKAEIKAKKKAKNRQPENDFSFKIIPVFTPKNGFLISKRRSSVKHINLNSFVKNKPHIFVTNQTTAGISRLTSNVEKLSINKNSTTKSEARKYPKKLTHIEPLPSDRKRRKPRDGKKAKKSFSEFLSPEEVNLGLEAGLLKKGIIRINPKNARNSYVSNEDSSKADYYLTSVADRNRALEGDEVILRIKPEKQWEDGKQTAAVVFISKQNNPGITVGTLKAIQRQEKIDSDNAVFYPRDKRMPILHIPLLTCPYGFQTNPKQFENILFVAKLAEWNEPSYGTGILVENLGQSNDLRVETLSILREFCLDITPFSPDVVKGIPKSKKIPKKELAYREDIRKECVFTIDPATARDLDDAVSVKDLGNGHIEIGVHISDASFYLEEGSELDQMVSKKATTIYMVDSVYHMLPVELCLFCSLLPGEDKLSFSVFWEVNEDGDIINKRFSRTIMNSCAQLSYEHAQKIIENPTKNIKTSDFPTIHNGFQPSDLKRAIIVLYYISEKLRETRMKNGALKIDQVKLQFQIHSKTGQPIDFWKQENQESHRLIEDFMLLANISVAERINESYPDIAFLRCHQPPKQTMLIELQNNLASYGIHIDISSAGGIHASLNKYISDDFAGQCRAAVLNHLTAKPMTRARYFCAGKVESELDYEHYALNVPIYTHFTSPIRRYADIMVHRLLAASLGYREKPNWDAHYVAEIATNCNVQKYNAKRAGEASGELFLAHYIEKHKPFIQFGVVVDVKERSFDVLILKTGSLVRIYQNKCEVGTLWKTSVIPTAKNEGETVNGRKMKDCEKKLLKLKITFPRTMELPKADLIVELFSLVKVNLDRQPKSYKLDATLLRQ